MNVRIRELRNELSMTQDAFAAELGIKKSALSMIETGKTKLSERNREIIIDKFNINTAWLDSGEGEMFTTRPHVMAAGKGDRNIQRVPLYNLEAASGLVSLFSNKGSIQPIDYIQIPGLPRCDGAVYVIGDSMYPLLKSGDIVLYKQIYDFTNIFWGEMYLMSIDYDGEEYITVKYIQKSNIPDSIKLVSQNPHHADKDVEISTIRAMAFVKASIRMNAVR